jgi:hypothetical protein
MSFPDKSTVYVYLYNNHFTQNIIEGVDVWEQQNIANCAFFATNAQMGKNVSFIGNALPPDDPAYPCGPVALFFPQFALTLLNTETLENVTVSSDGLSLMKYSFQNGDLKRQWADVESWRYSVWTEKHIAMGIYKYWGSVEGGLTGNFSLTLKCTVCLTQLTILYTLL